MRIWVALIFSLWLGAALAKNVPALTHEVNFLTLSDIHFDPFAYCDAKRPCPIIEKLRHANAQAWDQILATHGEDQPQQYRHDTNYQLLNAALKSLKQSAEANHVRFVLLLGDLLGHNYKGEYKRFSQDKSVAGYQNFVRKTLHFLTLKLSHTFPQVDVYITPGNNDTYQHDYTSQPGGAFFQETGRMWSLLIKNASNRARMQNQFRIAGYYAVDLAPAGVRLIMLNSNLFSYKARGKGVEKAAQEQLVWLHQQLQLAKEHQQKVFIAMHIPEAVDIYKSPRVHLFRILELWKSAYTEKFQTEIEAFSPEIAAIFAAHIHSDWFHVVTFNEANDVPYLGTPSISPVFGNNPGFKIYTYSLLTKQIDDFVTYYYPLEGKKVWDVAYGINQIYKPDCFVCIVEDDQDTIKESASLATIHKLLTTPDNTETSLAWRAGYWCAVHSKEEMTATKCGN